MTSAAPRISRSVTLNFNGDWGYANFHRICAWLTQEFCDRAGPRSRTAIWSLRGGGSEPLHLLNDGELDLCIATPTMMVPDALAGKGMFAGTPMPDLRALATIPQNDRMVFAIDPKFGISTFEELRAKKPALRIAASIDDGSNFIGYASRRMMEAHGLDEGTLRSWGCEYVVDNRPDDSLARMRDGEVDAIVQEAIMMPWWRAVIDTRNAIPLPAEDAALRKLESEYGYRRNSLPAGFFSTLKSDIPTLDFSDFAILVRSDLPDDVAYLLTWCLVETRGALEAQYRHVPSERSPVNYPIEPSKMAQTSIPLHPAARRFYEEGGYL